MHSLSNFKTKVIELKCPYSSLMIKTMKIFRTINATLRQTREKTFQSETTKAPKVTSSKTFYK